MRINWYKCRVTIAGGPLPTCLGKGQVCYARMLSPASRALERMASRNKPNEPRDVVVYNPYQHTVAYITKSQAARGLQIIKRLDDKPSSRLSRLFFHGPRLGQAANER